jgi:hypothetical protein
MKRLTKKQTDMTTSELVEMLVQRVASLEYDEIDARLLITTAMTACHELGLDVEDDYIQAEDNIAEANFEADWS